MINDEDKHKALSEAIRVAEKGGVIFAAYCNNDITAYSYFNKREILGWIDKDVLTDTYHFKSIPEEVFELYRKSDIDELMKTMMLQGCTLWAWICFQIFSASVQRISAKENLMSI